MASGTEFQYDKAFARNIGLVTEAEQARLRQACVALPGLGGVGGAHLQTLARLGITNFRLADLDDFDVGNIQRQLGATMESLGRPKVEVLAEIARSINPENKVQTFPKGINAENIGEFLQGVDVVVDGLEFFCIEARRMMYRECRKRRIPVVTAGPIGYGAAVLTFLPDGMSLDEYFRFDDEMTRAELLLAFGLGLAPGLIGDVDPKYIDIEAQKGPALISACMLCAGTAASEVLKLLTGRGKLTVAPRGIYYDPYRGCTRPLRPRPSLTKSFRGRLLKRLVFSKMKAFAAMHERELAARKGAVLPGAGQSVQPSLSGK